MALKIKHFTDYKKLEKFFNEFSKGKRAKDKDIKIVEVKGKVVFYLIIEV